MRITVGEEGLGEVDKWTLIVDCPYTESQQTHFRQRHCFFIDFFQSGHEIFVHGKKMIIVG